MKRRVVPVMLAACLVTSCAGPALALDMQWTAFFRAADPAGVAEVAYNAYGTGGAATTRLSDLPPDGVVLYCPDLGLVPPYWTKEIRAAQPAGVVMTWNLIVCAGPQYSYTTFNLSAWNLTGALYDIDLNPGFTVVLYRGAGVEFTFDPAKNGTSSTPQWTKSYAIPAGQTITDFRLVRQPVPEPASATALLLGVLALAASALRRRV